jgi:hypothetical protein
MIASIAMFDTYSGNYEDAPEAVQLKGAFLCTAEDIVAAYLGFDPKRQEHADVIASGSGSRRLYLPCRNITAVQALTVGTADVDTSLVAACDDHIRFVDHATKFPVGEDNIRLSYTAGWDTQEMPSVIVVSILRIATCMQHDENTHDETPRVMASAAYAYDNARICRYGWVMPSGWVPLPIRMGDITT